MQSRRLPAILFAVAMLLAPRVARGGDPADTQAEGGVAAGERPWSVHAATGFMYDSNVALDPSGQTIPGTPSDPRDGAYTISVGGRYDIVDTDRWQASVEYDLYQSLYFRLDDFNLRSNLAQATVGYALLPELWTGVQAGYQHYALGGPSYSGEPFVTPFVSLVEGRWGLTQFLYRHGDITYFNAFEDVRDGPDDSASLSQTIYWGAQYASVGYEFGSVRPSSHSAAANDYRYYYNQGYAGVGWAPGWQVTVDVVYLFRYENYTEPNSLTGFRTKRHDAINQFSVGVRRPLTDHLTIGLNYYGTVDDSNIDVYTYDRNVVAAEVRFAY
ncbi:MAG TPA: hypothetical protein VMS22_22865 [Candidatus Eisenbacteria bacterium]|nr:hypothetical protein [Candidatus Eisenbacteria bacterium]